VQRHQVYPQDVVPTVSPSCRMSPLCVSFSKLELKKCLWFRVLIKVGYYTYHQSRKKSVRFWVQRHQVYPQGAVRIVFTSCRISPSCLSQSKLELKKCLTWSSSSCQTLFRTACIPLKWLPPAQSSVSKWSPPAQSSVSKWFPPAQSSVLVAPSSSIHHLKMFFLQLNPAS
jgi:hypothetical protein